MVSHTGSGHRYCNGLLHVRQPCLNQITQRLAHAPGRFGVVMPSRNKDLEDLDIRLLCDMDSMDVF